MKTVAFAGVLALLSMNAIGSTAFAVAPAPSPRQQEEKSPAAEDSDAQASASTRQERLHWLPGPTTGKLVLPRFPGLAEVNVPDGYEFLGADDTRKQLEAWQNLTDGGELGMVAPNGDDAKWVLLFEFEDCGYVKDDEKKTLNADKMLASMRENEEAVNEARKEKGFEALHLVGWKVPPHYDESTHNLEWGTVVRSDSGESVNYVVKLLGRKGVVQATLLGSPAFFERYLPRMRELLTGFSFGRDNGYASYRAGDKIAEYGLTALVVGGAGAIALKTGLFVKFFKVIWKGLVVVGVGIAAWFKRLMGRRRSAPQS